MHHIFKSKFWENDWDYVNFSFINCILQDASVLNCSSDTTKLDVWLFNKQFDNGFLSQSNGFHQRADSLQIGLVDVYFVEREHELHSLGVQTPHRKMKDVAVAHLVESGPARQ